MKNLLKTGLFSVALLATVVVNASEKLNVKVASTSKMLEIELTKVVEGETLAIKDIDGQVLFFEQLTRVNEYSKVFSFSTLPEGLYFVESKDTSKIEVTPIIIAESGAKLVVNASKTYLAPKITLENHVLKVNVRNYLKVPVSIAIYDEDGVLLSSVDDNTNTLVFGSYVTSSAIDSSKLTVSVTEGDYSFVEDIRL